MTFLAFWGRSYSLKIERVEPLSVLPGRNLATVVLAGYLANEATPSERSGVLSRMAWRKPSTSSERQ